MSTKHNVLALRRQSIRILTPGELRVAQGGRPGNGSGGSNGTGTANTGATTKGTGTGTK